MLEIKNNNIIISNEMYLVFKIQMEDYSSMDEISQLSYFNEIRERFEQFDRCKIDYIEEHLPILKIHELVMSNPVQKYYANNRNKALNYLSENITRKTPYLIYQTDEDDIDSDITLCKSIYGESISLIQGEKLKRIASKIYERTSFKTKGNNEYNGELLIEDNTKMRIETENYYYSSLTVVSYPNKVNNFFLKRLINEKDTLVTIDYFKNDEVIIEEKIADANVAIEEKYKDNKKTSRFRAKREKKDIDYAYDQVIEKEKASCYVNITVHFKSDDLSVVEAWEDEMIRKYGARGIKLAPVFGKRKVYDSFKSMISYNKMHNKQFFITETLASAGFFDGGSIIDENAFFYGFCENGFPLILNTFIEHGKRKSFDALIFGKKGFGKTTLVKKMIIDNNLLNRYQRIFDVEGDYTYLVESLGGKVIDFTGDGFGINIFQVDRIEDSHFKRIQTTITKVANFITSLVDHTKEDAIELERILEEYYDTDNDYNFYTFIDYLSNIIESKIDEFDTRVVKRSLKLFKRIKESSILSKLFYNDKEIEYDDKLICYNLKSIDNIGGEYYKSLLFALITSTYAEAVKNKTEKFSIIIDECHRLINTSAMRIVEVLGNVIKQGRKYLIQLLLATQSINHIITGKVSDADLEKIKDFFNLSTYFFFFHQEKNQSEQIESVTSILPDYASKITQLKEHECVLHTAGKSTKLNMYIHKSDWKYYNSPKDSARYA